MSEPATAEQHSRTAHLAPYQFKPGQSGNPSGPKKGTRIRMGEQFFADLADIWHRRGADVLERLADEQPEVLFAGVVKLQPRLINLSDEREPLNDEQRATRLLAALRALHERGALIPVIERLGQAGSGDPDDSGVRAAGSAIELQPVSEAT